MNWLRILLCVTLVCCLASLADAGGLRKSPCASCDGGSCSLNQQMAAAKGWPWTPKPTPPAPVPAPAPPVPVVESDPCTPTEPIVVERVHRPGKRLAAATRAVARVPLKLAAKAIRITGAALKCPLRVLAAGHERRVERRLARRGG